MALKDMIKKRVFLEVDTKSGLRRYSGEVTDVTFMGKNTDGVEIWFVEIIDIYGSRVGFTSNSIKLIDEEK